MKTVGTRSFGGLEIEWTMFSREERVRGENRLDIIRSDLGMELKILWTAFIQKAGPGSNRLEVIRLELRSGKYIVWTAFTGGNGSEIICEPKIAEHQRK